MVDIRELTCNVLIAQARANRRLTEGALITAGKDAQPLGSDAAFQTGGAVVLRGRLHPRCFGWFADAERVWHRTLVLASQDRVGYVVFVQQVAAWQHRLVVQLVGDDVREFAQRVGTQVPRVLLEDADGCSRLPLQTPEPLPDSALERLQELPLPHASCDFAKDTVASLAHLLEPSAVAGCSPEPVRDVCVSFLKSPWLGSMLGMSLQDEAPVN